VTARVAAIGPKPAIPAGGFAFLASFELFSEGKGDPEVKRRALLGAAAVAALGGCGGNKGAGDTTGALSLWCWPGGLGEGVVADAAKRFPGLSTKIVDGVYLSALTPVLDSNQAPAIAGIKGEDISAVLPRADLFVDLNTLGAGAAKGDYLDWKWRDGSTLDNRLVGFPIDIGPTALFYRADLFQKAGLPADPGEVAKAIPNWAAFLAAGEKLRKKNIRLIGNASAVFGLCCSQMTKRFVDQSNHYVGNSPEIRTAWDIATEALQRGLSAEIQNDDKRWSGVMNSGGFAAEPGPAWHSADIVGAAPGTKGRWRVANGAADGGNVGGSFLSVPVKGRDHEAAFDVIKWILSPENQARMFAEAGLFPSAPAAYRMPELVAPDPFFGGQRTTGVFAASAAKRKRTFTAPADEAIQSVFATQLRTMAAGATTATTAWKNAVAYGRDEAKSRGVLTD
jgi:cellobiose transport system substrate-binding protein